MQSQSVNTIDNIVINTPKMIELDINRMLISHNKIRLIAYVIFIYKCIT